MRITTVYNIVSDPITSRATIQEVPYCKNFREYSCCKGIFRCLFGKAVSIYNPITNTTKWINKKSLENSIKKHLPQLPPQKIKVEKLNDLISQILNTPPLPSPDNSYDKSSASESFSKQTSPLSLNLDEEKIRTNLLSLIKENADGAGLSFIHYLMWLKDITCETQIKLLHHAITTSINALNDNSNIFQITPLHFGLFNQLQILEVFDNQNESLNPSGYTDAFKDNTNLILALIELGADVTCQDHQGNTPLHLARNTTVAAALVNAGASIECKNNQEEMPVYTLVKESIESYQVSTYFKTIQFLLSSLKKTDPNSKLLKMALEKAIAHEKNPDFLMLANALIENGAELTSCDPESSLLRDILSKPIIKPHHTNLVAFLIKHGADLKKADPNASLFSNILDKSINQPKIYLPLTESLWPLLENKHLFSDKYNKCISKSKF